MNGKKGNNSLSSLLFVFLSLLLAPCDPLRPVRSVANLLPASYRPHTHCLKRPTKARAAHEPPRGCEPTGSTGARRHRRRGLRRTVRRGRSRGRGRRAPRCGGRGWGWIVIVVAEERVVVDGVPLPMRRATDLSVSVGGWRKIEMIRIVPVKVLQLNLWRACWEQI